MVLVYYTFEELFCCYTCKEFSMGSEFLFFKDTNSFTDTVKVLQAMSTFLRANISLAYCLADLQAFVAHKFLANVYIQHMKDDW